MSDEIQEALGRILAKAGSRVMPSSADPPCGLPPWTQDAKPGVYCNGRAHFSALAKGAPAITADCPFWVAARVRTRIEDQRVLLAGYLARSGGGRFDGYDGARCKGAAQALAAMLHFSQGRPPERTVILSGETGTGKSRLLLASHIVLITAGVGSRYVTADDLRELFHRRASFDEAAHEEAEREMLALASVPVLHLDDLGDVRGSEAQSLNMASGLKALLDKRRGVLAVALNCTAAEARRHPELGDRVFSRLVDGAVTVRLEGADQRVASARRMPGE